MIEIFNDRSGSICMPSARPYYTLVGLETGVVGENRIEQIVMRK